MPDHTVEVAAGAITPTIDGFQLGLSGDLLDWVEINSEPVAVALKVSLELQVGELLKKNELLSLAVPLGPKAAEWSKVISEYQSGDHQATMDQLLAKLDVIVGRALGLTDGEIASVTKDCAEDAFLRRIKPRFPGAETRKLGNLDGLDRADRYA